MHTLRRIGMRSQALVVVLGLFSPWRGVEAQSDYQAEIEARLRRRGTVLVDSIRQVLAGPKLRFLDYVAAENVLLAEPAVLEKSGELQYQRLKLIAAAEAVRDLADSSILARYWRLSHELYLQQSPFDMASFPLSRPYWDLLARYPNASWSDEAAWDASQLRSPADECYSNCVMEGFIIAMSMQYWTRFPQGRHIDEALDQAVKYATYAEGMACPAGERQLWGEMDFSPQLAATIRRSLIAVTSPKKEALLKLLASGEAKCRKPPSSHLR